MEFLQLEVLGSPGQTRTADQVVTSALAFLPGLDYLITRPQKIGLRMSGASPPSLARRVRAEALVSAPSLNSHYFRAWLRITILHWLWRAGFPEFTRFFNHDFSWKLHVLQPPALPTELPGNIPFHISKNMIYASIKIFDFQQPAWNFQHEIRKKYKNLWTPIWLDRKGRCP